MTDLPEGVSHTGPGKGIGYTGIETLTVQVNDEFNAIREPGDKGWKLQVLDAKGAPHRQRFAGAASAVANALLDRHQHYVEERARLGLDEAPSAA